MLCKYKDIFGKPNTGLHVYRLFNIAIVDVILTLLVAYFISKYYKQNLMHTIIFMFVLSIIMHRIFCVQTTVDKLLFS